MIYRPEYDLKIIGKNLKRLREAKKLSVDEVRQYLRLGTPQAVYKYESGNGYPQADTMLALMELYGAEVHDIVDEHDDESPLMVLTQTAGEEKKKRLEEICQKSLASGTIEYFIKLNQKDILITINKKKKYEEEKIKRFQRYYDCFEHYHNKAV